MNHTKVFKSINITHETKYSQSISDNMGLHSTNSALCYKIHIELRGYYDDMMGLIQAIIYGMLHKDIECRYLSSHWDIVDLLV